MSEKTTTPADIVAEADAVIAQAEADMAATPTETEVDATDLARQMAKDYDILLTDIKGTGKNGRVTVPDVDKFRKELERVQAEGEPQTVEIEAIIEVEAEKPLIKKTLIAGDRLPNVVVGLEEVYHIVRSLDEMGMGWQSSKVSVADADERLSEMLSEGWELIHAQPLGYSQDGIDVLWVMGKFAEGKIERFPYREVHHITRRLGGMGDDGRGISGTQANALISGYLQSGWDLALVEGLDKSAGGAVNIMWIFVR